MKYFLLFISCFIFITSCEKNTEENQKNITIQNESDIAAIIQDTIAVFDTTFNYGKEVLSWHHNNIDSKFEDLKFTDDCLFIPHKTIMIDIPPPGNEYEYYALGVGKILKTKEKKLLPDTILATIRKMTLKSPNIAPDFFNSFIVMCFSEVYNISVAYKPELAGNIFWVYIKNDQPIFNELEKYENINSDNVYISAPLISGYYIVFNRDFKGNYSIITSGAAG